MKAIKTFLGIKLEKPQQYPPCFELDKYNYGGSWGIWEDPSFSWAGWNSNSQKYLGIFPKSCGKEADPRGRKPLERLELTGQGWDVPPKIPRCSFHFHSEIFSSWWLLCPYSSWNGKQLLEFGICQPHSLEEMLLLLNRLGLIWPEPSKMCRAVGKPWGKSLVLPTWGFSIFWGVFIPKCSWLF